jgi:DNA repair exonuclease SbcCD ATPase subunit
MSSSMYRRQVDALTKEIAALEQKAGDERGRAAKERGEALRIRGSVGSTTSQSTLQQKLKDAQRREERAATHDKAAGRIADQMSTKQRALTSASSNLERAVKQEREREQREENKRRAKEKQDRDKQEREDKRRRQAELDHLRELERRQRALQDPSPVLRLAAKTAPSTTVRKDDRTFEYDICLSFAGEDRAYVEMVAHLLKAEGVRVFYDLDETANLWGKELTEHLDHIYREASRFCVLFVSEAYAAKEWTRLERQSALSRAMREEGEYILPARFDDAELPGLRPTLAYIDLREYAPVTFVRFLLEKVRPHRTAA